MRLIFCPAHSQGRSNSYFFTMELCVYSMVALTITLATTQKGADLWEAGLLRGWELTTMLPVISSCEYAVAGRDGCPRAGWLAAPDDQRAGSSTAGGARSVWRHLCWPGHQVRGRGAKGFCHHRRHPLDRNRRVRREREPAFGNDYRRLAHCHAQHVDAHTISCE